MGQALGLQHRGLRVVEAQVVGHLLDVIDDVVEGGGQPQDVVAVDRRHERLVDAPDHLLGDVVAVLLADEDVPSQALALRESDQHLLQQLRRPDHVRRGALEQVEELAVPCAQQATQGAEQAPRARGVLMLAVHARRLTAAGLEIQDPARVNAM
jgi:hypothetical protein